MPGLVTRLREAARVGELAGAVAGITVNGDREVAAVGYADIEAGRPMTPETPIHVASLTKPVVATAAVVAFRDAGIDLDEPLVNLTPQLRPAWRASRWITLRHALSHTSGLRPDLPEPERPLADTAPDPIRDAVERTVAAPPVFQPGRAWQYCNAGYWLAGYALGQLANTSFERALGDYLLRPCGMNYTAFDAGHLVACGHAGGRPIRDSYWLCRRPAGGLISTVGDLLTFAEALFDREDLLEITGSTVAPSTLGSRYALGWNICHAGEVRWHEGDWGGCHALLLLHPGRRFAAAVVVNDDAGVRARTELGWAELSAATGLGRPRFAPTLFSARALVRYAFARVTSVGSSGPPSRRPSLPTR